MNVSRPLAEPPIVDSLESDDIGQGEKPLACLVHNNASVPTGPRATLSSYLGLNSPSYLRLNALPYVRANDLWLEPHYCPSIRNRDGSIPVEDRKHSEGK
jgi:hypothetical protein